MPQRWGLNDPTYLTQFPDEDLNLPKPKKSRNHVPHVPPLRPPPLPPTSSSTLRYFPLAKVRVPIGIYVAGSYDEEVLAGWNPLRSGTTEPS